MTLIHTVKMVDTHCHVCTIAFSVPKAFDDARKEDGVAFNCPNGHSLVYKKSKLDIANEEIEKIGKSLAVIRENRDMWKGWYEMERRSVTALKGHLTRLKNRLNVFEQLNKL